jgi:hypothetical protein
MPLRLRLTLLFVAATAAIVAVAGTTFLLQLHASLDDSLDTAIDTKLIALGERVADSGVTPATVHSDHWEEPVQVLGPTGAVLASNHRSLPALLDPARVTALLHARPELRDDRDDSSVLNRSAHFTRTVDGERMRIGAAVTGAGQVLVVGAETDITDAASDRIERVLLIGGAPAVLIAGLGAWALSGAALRPVARMSRQAAEISAQDTDSSLAVPDTKDEIAELARTMNALLGRHREALAGERRFVADASHELRTPLATLSAELELAEEPGRSNDDLRAAIRSARTDTDRLTKLATDLLLLARTQTDQPLLRPTGVNLRHLLDDAAEDANLRGRRTAEDGGRVTVHWALNGATTLSADPDRLRQVLDNLLENAARHAARGEIALTADRPDDHTVRIAVRDHGPGFPPEFLPHAFERFRRADTARARADGGTGLGLTIAAAIVDAHGGTITAANHADGGAVVTLTLPLPVVEQP